MNIFLTFVGLVFVGLVLVWLFLLGAEWFAHHRRKILLFSVVVAVVLICGVAVVLWVPGVPLGLKKVVFDLVRVVVPQS